MAKWIKTCVALIWRPEFNTGTHIPKSDAVKQICDPRTAMGVRNSGPEFGVTAKHGTHTV